jgi:sulfatase modifying factor 1
MRAPALAACAVLLVGCGDPPETVDASLAVSMTPVQPPDASPSPPASSVPGARALPCPDDMLYVDTTFCPDIERRCLDVEHERINHLDICHSFARDQYCRGEPRRIAFCIDRYEYPNQKGAHPVWMLDWYEAQATCGSKGKRLCWASEWTAACEGPEHTPFPYGQERDHRACNIDNFFIDPMRPGPRAQFFFYSKDTNIALRELSRLDQSVRSGTMETCRSGFGVYDMTGNLDEWVISDEPPKDKSKWAGLKGGAWGHVRSQCRPMTTSHEPEFRYYFVGFRCCADAVGIAQWSPSPLATPPPAVEPHDFAPDSILPVDPPGPSKAKFTWVRKRD